jgi:hypothetical protein
MSDIRVLAREGDKLFRVGKIAQLDAGNGLMVYTEAPARKQSIHSDGSHWDRCVGAGRRSQPTFRTPPSVTTLQTGVSVPISSDLTYRTRPFLGKAENALRSSKPMAEIQKPTG